MPEETELGASESDYLPSKDIWERRRLPREIVVLSNPFREIPALWVTLMAALQEITTCGPCSTVRSTSGLPSWLP
jgi:hypothetical protein